MVEHNIGSTGRWTEAQYERLNPLDISLEGKAPKESGIVAYSEETWKNVNVAKRFGAWISGSTIDVACVDDTGKQQIYVIPKKSFRNFFAARGEKDIGLSDKEIIAKLSAASGQKIRAPSKSIREKDVKEGCEKQHLPPEVTKQVMDSVTNGKKAPEAIIKQASDAAKELEKDVQAADAQSTTGAKPQSTSGWSKTQARPESGKAAPTAGLHRASPERPSTPPPASPSRRETATTEPNTAPSAPASRGMPPSAGARPQRMESTPTQQRTPSSQPQRSPSSPAQLHGHSQPTQQRTPSPQRETQAPTQQRTSSQQPQQRVTSGASPETARTPSRQEGAHAPAAQQAPTAQRRESPRETQSNDLLVEIKAIRLRATSNADRVAEIRVEHNEILANILKEPSGKAARVLLNLIMMGDTSGREFHVTGQGASSNKASIEGILTNLRGNDHKTLQDLFKKAKLQ